MASTEIPQKGLSPRKSKKRGNTPHLSASDTNLSVENNNTHSKTDIPVENGDTEQNDESQLRLENKSLQMQVESSLAMVENIKKSILEFEKVMSGKIIYSNNNRRISEKEDVSIEDIETFMNTLINHKRKIFEQEDIETIDKKKKRKLSKKSVEDDFVRENEEKNVSEIANLQALVKKHETKIHGLEKKLDKKAGSAKAQVEYISESPTESEEESDHSEFDPFDKSGGDIKNRKRGRTSQRLKGGKKSKKSRGRPKKSVVHDESSNSGNERSEKKGRGRPRKSVVENESSESNEELKAKNPIGRPTKVFVKDENSNSTEEPKEKKPIGRPRKTAIGEEISNSSEEPKEKKPIGRPRKTLVEDGSSNSNIEPKEKKPTGRPKKISNDNSADKEKRPRGRPKTSIHEVEVEVEKESQPVSKDNVSNNGETDAVPKESADEK